MNPRKITKINEQDYEYEIFLFNKNGQGMLIDEGKIKRLIIIDNFLNTFLK